MRRNRLVSQSGFSLLEVLLAITLTGLAAAALTGSFLQTTYTQKQLNGRVIAHILGAGKLAELTGGSELAGSGVFSEPYQQYQWWAREEKTGNGMIAVFLTVEWSKGNEKAQKSLVGYKEPNW